MLKPGFLIHYKGNFKFRFCPMDKSKINNSLRWSKRILVDNKQENSVLLFVEPLDLTKETAATGAPPAGTAAVWAATPSAASSAAPMATWNAAKKEFDDTGKIPGGIFLTGNGKLIWVSHYDQKELMK